LYLTLSLATSFRSQVAHNDRDRLLCFVPTVIDNFRSNRDRRILLLDKRSSFDT
jgi:hypothetical protein